MRTIGLSLLFLTILCLTVAAGAESLVLPSGVRTVEAMAFMGDESITEAVIQEGVEQIGDQAFSGCTALRTVTFLSRSVRIARNAFENCPDLTFQVYEGSTAELYALSHGYRRSYLDSQSSVYERIMAMIGQYTSQGSTLQGKESRRVIIRVSGDHLPDISGFEPVSIVPRSSSIYFVQLPTEDATVACYEAMQALVGSEVVYAEYDASTSAIDDEVSAAGVMSWANSDPMGFDTYAPYVAGIETGSALIAVVDSGVNRNASYNHRLSSASINLIDDGQSDFYDGCRHGSLIASIINDCAGDANVKILSVRVVNNRNQTTPSLLGMGIAYAAEHGAHVINLSLNTSASAYVRDELQSAMRRARIVVAAGNDNINTSKVFPANVTGTIVVSGLQDAETIWHESNTGAQVMFAAPAVGISTAAYPSIPAGTSFAAPMISTLYALVGLDGTHSVNDMIDSCIDLGSAGKDSVYGYGMPDLNVLAALKVTSITADNAPALMLVGDAVTLDLTIQPARALDRTVTCVSSDENVLSVSRTDEGGLTLTALASGHATVTVTANDGGGASVAFDVTVVQEVESVTIRADSDELPMTRTMTLAVAISPTTADDQGIVWTSSNPEVAAVSADGLVTPVAPGAAVILAEAQDGYGAADELRLTVIEIPDAEAVGLLADGQSLLADDELNVRPGDVIRLTAQVYPVDAEQDVTWSIRAVPRTCATVDQSGQVTAVSAGAAFVTATTGNNCRGEVAINIMVMPTGVEMTGESILQVGATSVMSATVFPEDFVTDPTVRWISGNEAVATVDQNGVVTGVSGGDVTIYARASADETVQASKMITVRQMPQRLELSGEERLFIGYGQQLTALITPATTYDLSVTWVSSDPAVASVDENGLVTGLAEGTATITATSNADPAVADVLVVSVKPEWNEWTAWSGDPVEQTDDMEVETRTEYRYRDITYSAWSKWGAWTKTRQSVTDADIKQEASAKVYGWYYYLCPYCGNHNRYYTTCSSCGKTVGRDNTWHAYSTDQPWTSGVQGQSYTETYYGYGLLWSWSDSTGQSQIGTGYRYRTRTRTVSDWSAWSDTAVTASDTREVETRTACRYRLRNVFDESDISGWVTEDQLPEGAVVVNNRWTYTETTTSTAESMDGWTRSDGGWTKTGEGTVRYASFSSYPGFDRTNALYKKFNVSAPVASESAAARRTVTTSQDGWIYWHWMYSVSASAYDRVILYQTGYGPSGHTTAKYNYKYFQAYESSKNYSKTSANDGQNTTLYSWYLNQDSAYQSNAVSGGSWYWYRIPITKATYTDYTLSYTYTREMETSTEPAQGAGISNVVRYVRYLLGE